MTGQSRPRVQILVQRQPVDPDLLAELVTDECAQLGLTARMSWIDDLATVRAAISGAQENGRTLLLITSPQTPDLVDVGLGHAHVARVDLHLRDADPSPGLRFHIQGRGIDGVRWALRTVHHGARWPEHRSSYGDHSLQYGALRLATDVLSGADGDVGQPVVVLLHGGFWRARWQMDLMDALAVDLAERGLASWNVEYRSPDRHGWSATMADVRAAVAHVARLAEDNPIDPGRMALVGHSAGGQLAVQLAADLNRLPGNGSAPLAPKLVVQLAGLVDLVETDRRDLGNGAVPLALGGTPDEVPAVYAAASPLLRVPIGVRQLAVVGRGDSADLREMSRRYVRAAKEGGDQIELIEDDGDHFTVIDPASQIWGRTAGAIAEVLAG